MGAGAAGGALAAFVTFWLLILGSFFGGPRPSPSAWTWQGVMFAQLYLAIFLMLGAAIGGVLGLPSGGFFAWLIASRPSSRARRMLVLGFGLVGMAAMWVLETRFLDFGGTWMTLSFMFGGLIGGAVGARLWLRSWASHNHDQAAVPY
jgi:hypothetical protein